MNACCFDLISTLFQAVRSFFVNINFCYVTTILGPFTAISQKKINTLFAVLRPRAKLKTSGTVFPKTDLPDGKSHEGYPLPMSHTVFRRFQSTQKICSPVLFNRGSPILLCKTYFRKIFGFFTRHE